MTQACTERLIQIFLKAPEPGKVKTRLIPDVGIEQATAIHIQLFEKVLKVANACDVQVECWVAGDFPHPYIQALTTGYKTIAQTGIDLGERMQHALMHGLQRHHRVVLVGADAYSLTPEIIEQAFAALQEHNVVLGPAQDGGYILIGAKRLHPLMFKDIDWGTDSVLAEQQENLKRCGLSYQLLENGFDIDTIADIKKHAPELLGV